MNETMIQWTDTTWNFLRGCSRKSEGCGVDDQGGCYAEKAAYRFSGKGQPYEGLVRLTKKGPRWTGEVRHLASKLAEPLSIKKGVRVFVNSMSDFWHDEVSNGWIAAAFGVMACCPQHQFQILTKRPERMPDWFAWAKAQAEAEGDPSPLRFCVRMAEEVLGKSLTARIPLVELWPLPNVWLGISAESQERYDERIECLFRTPAEVRFLSCEPLLGPLSLHLTGIVPSSIRERYTPVYDLIDMVIVGGESGDRPRPMDLAWARALRDECQASGVAFFMKQLGSAGRADKGGNLDDLPEDLRIRQFPEGVET